VLAFWNRVMQRPDQDLVKLAALESAAFAVPASNVTWGRAVVDCVRSVDGVLYERVRNSPGHGVDVDVVMRKVHDGWQAAVWQPLTSFLQQRLVQAPLAGVRACPDDLSKGFKLFVYHRWIRQFTQPFERGANWTYHVHEARHVAAMARFRMGCSWLNIERMRYARPTVPRSQRVCACCTVGTREDEMHLFECEHYALLRHEARFEQPALAGTDDEDMYALMNMRGEAWCRFAHLLFCMYKSRETVLAQRELEQQ
jgi:hypothetical protein